MYFVALFILPAIWGAEAIFYAEPISDVVGPFTTMAVYGLTMNKILKRRQVTQ